MYKLLLLFIGIVLVIVVRYFQLKRKVIKNNLPQNYSLKKNGKILRVNTSELQVKSNHYWENNEIPISRISMVDSFYDNEKNFLQDQRFSTVIVYEGNLNGHAVKYVSPEVNMDDVTLRYRLLSVSEVSIYIDPNDDNKYYFDLSFLSSNQ
jgi:hypothetical protein